jgi:hypothetical protein
MTQYEKLKVSYDVWKQVYTNHSTSWSAYQTIAGEHMREVFSGNSEYVFTTLIGEDIYNSFSVDIEPHVTTVSSSDDAVALIVAGVSNIIATPKDASGHLLVALNKTQRDNVPLVALQGRICSEVLYATHNFCDKSTWFGGSTRVTSASLIQTGSVWYHSASGYGTSWIDLKHGKIFDEEGMIEDQKYFAGLVNEEQHGYSIDVIVDGVPKTERNKLTNVGGDYIVDYSKGTIEPITENWVTSSVTASFSRANSSAWYLTPLEGKSIVVEKAEIQFSTNIDFNTSFTTNIEGYAAIFAPQYIQANGGPLPNDARITIQTTTYKTIDQIVDEAVGAYPEIPSFTSGSLRGLSSPRHIFHFHYTSVRKLYSSLGMRMVILTENDIQFGGDRATATFYCMSENDPGIQQALINLGLM